MKRIAWRLLPALIISLPLGYFLSGELNHFLAISISEKNLPVVTFDETSESQNPKYGKNHALPWRMADIGAVGIDPDSSIWGKDYSHNTHRFRGAILDEAPFIDSTVFSGYYRQFQAYVDRMAELGFNAIEMSGFLTFVDFNKIDDGFSIYPKESIYRKRQSVFRQHFRKWFEYAKAKKLKVILKTDMVALTRPLEAYFKDKVGGLNVESEVFWQVYQKGLEELFEHFPQIDGLMIRIGEAGAVYNRPDWDYRSELLVRSVKSVQMMLRAFLDVAEAHDRNLIFRTWSVGVGEVGNIHTDAEKYARVLDDIESENLIISTKFTQGDFWNHLPLNETLFSGNHKRIIEMQARREFEAFNVIPNYVAPLHQTAFREFQQKNPNIVGFWVWTQSGGPIHRGSMMLYPFHGFWLWTDANVYATAQVAKNPERTIKSITEDWVRNEFGNNPEVISAITKILLGSHEIAASGLTIPAFASKQVKGLGLEVPPVIYSYWDIVDASTAFNSHLYYTAKNNFKTTIAEISEPAEKVRDMQQIAQSISEKVVKGKHWIPFIIESLKYEENLFEVLAAHKKFLLYYYRWLDTGRNEDKTNWQEAAHDYYQKRNMHSKYLGNLDFPAYNFELADRGVAIAQKTDGSIWFARILLFLMLAAPTFYGFGRGWFPKELILVLSAIMIVGILATFGSLLAPNFTLLFSIIFVLYFLAIHQFFAHLEPLILPHVGLPILIFSFFVMGTVAVSGPQYFWYNFWLNETFRTYLVITIVFSIVGHTISFFSTFRKSTFLNQAGRLLVLFSLPLLILAAVFIIFGFEKTLSILNDELLLLPGMMSRILGITTHLNIPTALPFNLFWVGLALLITGIIVIFLQRFTSLKKVS